MVAAGRRSAGRSSRTPLSRTLSPPLIQQLRRSLATRALSSLPFTKRPPKDPERVSKKSMGRMKTLGTQNETPQGHQKATKRPPKDPERASKKSIGIMKTLGTHNETPQQPHIATKESPKDPERASKKSMERIQVLSRYSSTIVLCVYNFVAIGLSDIEISQFCLVGSCWKNLSGQSHEP